MTRANETYAYFSLHGDFDPADVTRAVGIQPTKTWKKGDPTPNRNHIRVFSRWSLYSTLPKSERLEAHVTDVLRQLDDNESGFRTFSTRYSGTLQLVGYFWDNFRGLYFDQATIAGFARYGLAMDCDFYGLYSHRREDTGFTYDPEA